jgi:hypothetical protein
MSIGAIIIGYKNHTIGISSFKRGCSKPHYPKIKNVDAQNKNVTHSIYSYICFETTNKLIIAGLQSNIN